MYSVCCEELMQITAHEKVRWPMHAFHNIAARMCTCIKKKKNINLFNSRLEIRGINGSLYLYKIMVLSPCW